MSELSPRAEANDMALAATLSRSDWTRSSRRLLSDSGWPPGRCAALRSPLLRSIRRGASIPALLTPGLQR